MRLSAVTVKRQQACGLENQGSKIETTFMDRIFIKFLFLKSQEHNSDKHKLFKTLSLVGRQIFR
jgi:hypothetical protein